DMVDGDVDSGRANIAPLAQLKARHGVWAAPGNHEYYSGYDAWMAEFRRLGLNLLENRMQLIDVQGARLALSGIGDPARFVATLRASGANVIAERAFADHHPFTPGEIEQLISDAATKSLMLVTTEKDMARIRSDARIAYHAANIRVLPVTLTFDDEAALRDLLARGLAKARGSVF
ncbi:MAG: tetraacyldisaccharide 4'-kinase, partial [Afipia sp.]|nr:tetraacyldisaccharide 4'-kinase [Afipia sp.]